jgi:hypothetical protein
LPHCDPADRVLNILVASIARSNFGALVICLEIILAICSAFSSGPYFGGHLQPSASVLRILIGLVLIFSAVRLIFRRNDLAKLLTPSQPTAISVGAGLGFLSGLTGTGGGIFLTPLLLFCRWAHIRQAAAISALFILVNSIAGLAGYFTAVHSIPSLGIALGARGSMAAFWFSPRKPPFSSSHHFDHAGDRPQHRRSQINFYQVTIPIAARSEATRDSFHSRTRQFDRRIRAKADKAPRHPVHDVAGGTSTSSFPRVETNAPQAVNVCGVSRVTDVRISFGDGRKRRRPESALEEIRITRICLSQSCSSTSCAS